MISPNSLALAFDLGGTKLASGVVDSRGKILAQDKQPVNSNAGPQGLIKQLSETGNKWKSEFPNIRCAGLASAGPLDPSRGLLLNPTNLTDNGKHWGVVALTEALKVHLNLPLVLENDAAAAVLAEHWLGEAKGEENLLMLTLGTGLGVGIITHGELVRAGQGLHTEGGHIVINFEEKNALCGCGNYGCAEAYLSGMHFAKNFARDYEEPHVTGEILVRLARQGDSRALEAFRSYGKILAVVINNFVVLHAPQTVILAGGFSHASDLFLTETQNSLDVLLRNRRVGVDMMPKILVSQFKDEIGLLGAAYVAFQSSPT